MPDIKATEREFQIRAIGWVNEYLRTGGFPFEVASGSDYKLSETLTARVMEGK